MKKLPLTIRLLLIASFLLISGDILSNIPSRSLSPANAPLSYTAFNAPVFYHPLGSFFPLQLFNQDVCHRPLLSVSQPPVIYPYIREHYQFMGLRFKTQPLGTHFIQINNRLTYKKGNTYLLIPRSFIMPTDPDLSPHHPSVTLPGSD